MGHCCCKEDWPNDGPYSASNQNNTRLFNFSAMDRDQSPIMVNNQTVEELVIETFRLIPSYVDNTHRSSDNVPPPLSMLKLQIIAENEEGWLQLIKSIVKVTGLDDPFGPSSIAIILDDCPLPSQQSLSEVGDLFSLSAERADSGHWDLRIERNICVVLGCIAHKLAGPKSATILTPNTLEYLFSYLNLNQQPGIVLFALIAIEKFAQTTENKLTIKRKLDSDDDNPFINLLQFVGHPDYEWRQVGFCAQWTLDNLFPVQGRQLTYEAIDMSQINAILNCNDVSEYLKISPNGQEARCDSHSFESVRCTFKVESGCWYYECSIVTPGVMQIGWATRQSRYLNHEGLGIGDDTFSLSYDGCRKLVWHKAISTPQDIQSWRAGDVLGCLVDVEKEEMIFSLNGKQLSPCSELFKTAKTGFYAGASFMAFQQCSFNFGLKPFQYPPRDREFKAFNDHGVLTDEEKRVLPRHIIMERLRNASIHEDTCVLCFDEIGSCTLQPCSHGGFCFPCTLQLSDCPLCRAPFLFVDHA